MTDKLKDNILTALSAVRDGESDIVSSGMVQGLSIGDNGAVFFLLSVDAGRGPALEPLRRAAEEAVRAVPGVTRADAVLTADRPPAQTLSAPGKNLDPHGMEKNPKLTLPFRHIIAVASGKGGVGKSTLAFNLAVALAAAGYETALLDADIYGPSVPLLSGLSGTKPATNGAGKLVPLTAHGLKLMSMGFLVEAEKPTIWRGPMIQTAFYQMLRDVAWRNDPGKSDVLVIDMPPGTGDVQLTLAQKVPVTGAVIVSTPQDIALIDARKAIAMFEKTGVKVLGLIENMSYYCCPSCGHRDDIFGHGGAAMEAQKHGVPFLGEIPLTASIRQQSDAGQPASSKEYQTIALKIMDTLGAQRSAAS
jgi:ATP-binding protein involved in chromosome partitioning